jgi:hypothetical protein
MWPTLFSRIVFQELEECPCSKVAYYYSHIPTQRKGRLSSFVLQAFIENNVSNEQCFEFYLENVELGHTRGFQYLLDNHYHKEFDEFTEREVLELLVIPHANTKLYPIRNPENLERRVYQLMEKFDSSEREWKLLKHGLYINTAGEIGFATERDLVFIPPSEIEGERSMCPNNFLTTFGYDDSTRLKSIIDVNTFESLGAFYYKDKNRVYTHYSVCDGGAFKIFANDTVSFKVLGLHATYKSKAYHYRRGQLDADIATFTTYRSQDHIARDKYGFFSFGERITTEELKKRMGEKLYKELLNSAIPPN